MQRGHLFAPEPNFTWNFKSTAKAGKRKLNKPKNKTWLLIKDKYFSSQTLSEKDYERGRKLFIADGCFANGVVAITSGVILAGFLEYLGANNVVNGIISGIPNLAGTLLIFSPVILQKVNREKWVVLLFGLIHRFLFALMMSVPLVFTNLTARLVVFVFFLATAHILGSFISPSTVNWLVKLIPEEIRGRYLGLREGIIIIFMALFSFLMALIIDYTKDNGKEMAGYLICSIAILLMAIGNFIFLLNAKEPVTELKKSQVGIRQVLTIPLKDRGFRKILVLSILWNFGLQFGGPYFSIYYYSILRLGYTYIIAIGFAVSLARMIAAQFWGRFADYKGWIFVSKTSILCLGVVHVGYMFLNRETMHIIYPLLTIMGGICWGGVSISIFNIGFEYMPVQDRTSYISFNTAVSSIAGFSGVLAGSLIVSLLQDRIYSFLSIPLSAMQFLFIGSGILLMATSGYIHRFIVKIPI